MKNTQKITVQIEGMMCGMCEAHVCDTIRRAIPQARKVSASHVNGEATFLVDGSIDAAWLKKSIAETGYKMLSLHSEPYVKKSFFGF